MKTLALLLLVGCSSAPDVPGPEVYCVVQGKYQACDSSHPWYYPDNNPMDHAIFCACDEACGNNCADGTVCALPDGQNGVCRFVPKNR